MKRTEQIWGIIIGIAVTTFVTVALFHLTQDSLKIGHQFTTSIPTSTADLFTNHNSKKDLPSPDDKQSPKEPPIYILHASSVYNINYSIGLREIMPFWERAFDLKEPRILLSSFLPILVISIFAAFYRSARSNPGDDDFQLFQPDLCDERFFK